MNKLGLSPLTERQQEFVKDVDLAWREFEASLDVMATCNDLHQVVIDHMLVDMRQAIREIWARYAQLQ